MLGHTQRGQLMAVMGLKMSQDKPALACSIPSSPIRRPTVLKTSVRFGALQELCHCRPDCLVIYGASLPHPLRETAKPCSKPASRGLCCSNECVQLAWGKSRYDGHLGVIKYFQWSLLKKKQTNSARPIFERSANPEPPLAKWTQ